VGRRGPSYSMMPDHPSLLVRIRPPVGSRSLQSWLQWIGPAGLAGVLAVVALALNLQGTDVAMQTYRADQLRLHGFVIWDSGWYGGSYPLSYTVLSPVISALIGVAGASVLSAMCASWFFDRVVQRMTGRRTIGSWYFAVSTLLAVTIGQLPYLTGETVALAAVLALLHRRTKLGVALGMISALFSPLAAAFLILACGVWAVHERGRRWPMIVTVAGTGALVLGISFAFPGDGPFPFHWAGMVIVELLCLLVISPLVRTTPTVRLAAAVYGLATLGSFIVPNPLGGNATRLADSIGVPIVACLMTMPAPVAARRRASSRSLRLWATRLHVHIPGTGGPVERWGALRRPFAQRAWRRRPELALGLLLPFVVWQWSPSTGVVSSAASPTSNTAAFYQPLVRELAALDRGQLVRVEVAPTRDHWESAYVAPYVSVARGWERQLDVADNPIFYVPGKLNAGSYRTWLDENGVSYVALPDAPLDYAGVAEAALLRTGRVPGLHLVWQTASWRLWMVQASPGLVTGAARLTTMAPDRLVLHVARPGDFLVRVRYITYWHLVVGAACVQAAPGEVHAFRAGTVSLDAELVGKDPAACASP
jgi:hypothetical protein